MEKKEFSKLTKIDSLNNPEITETCLVQKFLKDQEKLPVWQRTKIVYLSCPCRKCQPIW